ncbi:MAG: ornithine cyclodeaminase family protein [Patulibacter sp.]|nr:ornithine cyclodeaminase family protein [Patulibacter sp.]
MVDGSVLVVRERELRDLVGPADALPVVHDAFVRLGRGEVEQPDVLSLELPAHRGEVHAKGAYVHGAPTFAIKVASGFYDNPARGLPVSAGAVWVFDARTGALRAMLLDNGFLTELRTGAAGALSVRLMARQPVRTVAVVGTGGQARHQLRALATVCAPTHVRIWGRRAEAAARCARELSDELGLRVEAVASLADGVGGADVVVTTTPSRTPLVRAEWVSPGTHVVAVGSDLPGKVELDPALLGRATVVADRLAQCREQGEIAAALAAGTIVAADVVELGAIAAGDAPGRRTEDEITVADFTGVGVLDTAIAGLAVDRARAAGVGEQLRP